MHLPVGLPAFEQRAEVRHDHVDDAIRAAAPARVANAVLSPANSASFNGFPVTDATGTSTMRGIVRAASCRMPQGANEFRLRGIDAHQHQTEHQIVSAREVAIHGRPHHAGLVGDLGHPDLRVAAARDAPTRSVQEQTTGLVVVGESAVVAPTAIRLTHSADAYG